MKYKDFYHKFWKPRHDGILPLPDDILDTLDTLCETNGLLVINAMRHLHFRRGLDLLTIAMALYTTRTVAIITDKRKPKDYYIAELYEQYGIIVAIVGQDKSSITLRICNFEDSYIGKKQAKIDITRATVVAKAREVQKQYDGREVPTKDKAFDAMYAYQKRAKAWRREHKKKRYVPEAGEKMIDYAFNYGVRVSEMRSCLTSVKRKLSAEQRKTSN